MLNLEKIRLMTRLTVYEEGGGTRDRRTAGFFPGDYVFAQMVWSFVTGTIAWGICAAVYCGYYFEQIFFSVYEDAAGPVLRFAVLSYAAWIVFFLLVTFLVYRKRSIACQRRRRLYEQDLDAMLAICEEERAVPGGSAGVPR
ncbi:MAG: hypothetical protein Q4C02_00020 [Eubacteriales bacterium]|nr:hypothetical protein [Lachnospiraceae bacterium]MDO4416649.1 hypothetical protein [Eubacteriales bacterium]